MIITYNKYSNLDTYDVNMYEFRYPTELFRFVSNYQWITKLISDGHFSV